MKWPFWLQLLLRFVYHTVGGVPNQIINIQGPGDLVLQIKLTAQLCNHFRLPFVRFAEAWSCVNEALKGVLPSVRRHRPRQMDLSWVLVGPIPGIATRVAISWHNPPPTQASPTMHVGDAAAASLRWGFCTFLGGRPTVLPLNRLNIWRPKWWFRNPAINTQRTSQTLSIYIYIYYT